MGFSTKNSAQDKGVITMKFDEIGINRLYDANSIEEANKVFARSCHCCCVKNRQVDCDKCNIAFVHKLVVATFNDMNKMTKGV